MDAKKIMLPETELEISFSRSSGPGGQNVNKVNSKATIHWDVLNTTAFSPAILQRFRERFSNTITKEGKLVVSSDRFRDQSKNINDCKDKIRTMLAQVFYPPKKRIATRPSTAQKNKRLRSKKTRSERKESRKKIDY